MSTVDKATDTILVSRDGTDYRTTVETMSALADTDLLLINRGGVDYRCEAKDVKAALGGGAFVAWESIPLGATAYPGFYAVGASANAMCVCCTDGTVRRTADGLTWTTVLSGLSNAAIRVSGDKWIVTAGTNPNYTYHGSIDDGATWSPIGGTPSSFRFAGGDPYDSSGTFWAVQIYQGGVSQLSKSTDAGATWTTVPTNLVFRTPEATVADVMMTHSADGLPVILVRELYYGDGPMWASKDGGTTWFKATNNIGTGNNSAVSFSLLNPLYNGGYMSATSSSDSTTNHACNFHDLNNGSLVGAWDAISYFNSSPPDGQPQSRRLAVGSPTSTAASSNPIGSGGNGYGFTFSPVPAPADQPAVSQQIGVQGTNHTARQFKDRWYYFSSTNVIRQKS